MRHIMMPVPKAWREGLLGRTGAKDNGRVFELLWQADALIEATRVAGLDRSAVTQSAS